MNYATFLTWLITVLQVSDTAGVTALTNVISLIIAYAEGRLYRDPALDFLATRVTDVSQSTVAGSRAVAIPAEFIVVEGVSLVTPANTVPSAAGASRIPYLRTTRAFIDLTWPTESETAAPDLFAGGYYALFSEQEASSAPSEDEARPLPSSILLAPTPNDSFRVEFTGTQRPTPLSAENPTTFLTTYLPDLFFAAAMVIASGYQRDFGGQSDDPKLAMSWESLFQELKRGASIEELRKKALIDGFSSLPPRPPTSAEQMAAQAAAMRQGG